MISEGYMGKRYPEFMKRVRVQEADCKKLKAENEKLKGCVEFYAKKENWYQIIDTQYNIGKIWVYTNPDNKYMDNSITTENGAIARQTLKEIESSK